MENEIKTIETAIIEVKTLDANESIEIAVKTLKITKEQNEDQKTNKKKSKIPSDKQTKQTSQPVYLRPKSKSNIVNLPPAKFVSLSEAPFRGEPNQKMPHSQSFHSNQILENCDQVKNLNIIKQKDSPKIKKEKLTNVRQTQKNSPCVSTLNKGETNDSSQQFPKQNNRGQLKKSASSIASMNSQQEVYEPYWNEKLIEESIVNKTLIQGKLRINQRSYEDAFVSDPDGGSDIYINGIKDRNRALNNDIVAVKLKEKYSWKISDNFKINVQQVIKEFEEENKSLIRNDLIELLKKSNTSTQQNALNNNNNRNQNEKKELIEMAPLTYSNPELLKRLSDDWFQRTGTVVGIIEKKNNRWAAGHLKLFQDKNKEFALFSPNDSRIPRMKIKLNECPPDFYTNSQIYSNTLFVAQILDIPSNSRYAIGELKRSIGLEGNTDVETEAILIENGVDFSEFDETVVNSLPQTPWSIPEEEYSYRKDLRDMCIFTIDPATARDLDDALHIVQLEDDLYEVGVHIADVSYFVAEDSPIDKCASERATSVYLVQKVIPMLPRLLCEQLCSLNPGTDRLTFSVIWKINSNGDILEEWFGRTVINSVVKLSYDHAQSFIENPDKDFGINEFPPIRKEFNLNQIKTSVLNLHKIALKLRAKRFDNGCLVLNQVKINYILNKETGLPFGYNVYQQKDSNRLVEEFMLLANIAVAHRIYDKFPHKAILRRHPTPNSKQLMDLGESIKSCGFDCDISSSSSIQTFLQKIQKENSVSSLTLTCLLTKTMQLAQYFCSGLNLSKEQFYHYGLAVPLYTHFTSPIRRYPDVLVHRLLAASLGYCPETNRGPTYLQSIAENCNDKKYNARVCSEKSSEMFFSLFVNECGPFEEIGCVIQIKDRSFDVLLVNLGISKRIYCDKLDILEDSVNYVRSELKPEISFVWNSNDKHKNQVEQRLELFSNVNVLLTKHESDQLKFNITLKHPNEKLNLLNVSKLFNEMKEKKEIIEEEDKNEAELLYLQRVDTDPYICD